MYGKDLDLEVVREVEKAGVYVTNRIEATFPPPPSRTALSNLLLDDQLLISM